MVIKKLNQNGWHTHTPLHNHFSVISICVDVFKNGKSKCQRKKENLVQFDTQMVSFTSFSLSHIQDYNRKTFFFVFVVSFSTNLPSTICVCVCYAKRCLLSSSIYRSRSRFFFISNFLVDVFFCLFACLLGGNWDDNPQRRKKKS